MSRYKKRSQRGQLLLELGATLPIIVFVLAIGFNSTFGILAWLCLDGACIDAARAASTAPNLAIARARAEVAVKTHSQGGLNPIVKIDQKDYHNENGDYTKDPYFILRANVDYKLPFPALNFGGQTILPQALHLTRIYAYPILTVDQDIIPADQTAAGGAAIPIPRVTFERVGPRGMMAMNPTAPIAPDLSGVN